MGIIKIGSSKHKKGITINPKIIYFDDSKVKKIMSESTEVWNGIKGLVPSMT